jgi:hypothetical protein
MRMTWPKFVVSSLMVASFLGWLVRCNDQPTPNCEATNLSNFAKDSVRHRLVQAAKAKARGYHSLRNLIAITYLIAGNIDLKLAT